MKILAIHNFYKTRSGEDIAFLSTVDALRRAGNEIHIFSRDSQAIDEKSPFVSACKVLGNLFFSARSFLAILKEVKKNRPDVALVQNVFPLISPSVYLALKISRIPVVQRLFNYRLVCTNGVLYTQGQICERCVSGNYLNAVRYRCYRKSRTQSALFAASLWVWRTLGVWRWGVKTFIAPDKFLGTKVLAVIKDPKKISVVFNPAALETFNLLRESAMPVSERERRVLFVGRLVREKGVFTLVRLAKLLPEIPFDVVGAGDDAEEAKKLAEVLGVQNIQWLGVKYAKELHPLLNKTGALVLPSEWYDNMPLILTQALLCRAPIVASRIDGIPEFILEGVTGRLAEPSQPESYAERLRELFKNPEQTQVMADEGRLRAEQWFGPQGFDMQMIEVLRNAQSIRR